MPKKSKDNEEFPYTPNDPIEFENIYEIVHYVQHYKKECTFMSSVSDAVIIENILKDAEIKFKKISFKKGIRYALEPSEEKEISEDMFVFDELLDDEQLEEGEIF